MLRWGLSPQEIATRGCVAPRGRRRAGTASVVDGSVVGPRVSAGRVGSGTNVRQNRTRAAASSFAEVMVHADARCQVINRVPLVSRFGLRSRSCAEDTLCDEPR